MTGELRVVGLVMWVLVTAEAWVSASVVRIDGA